MPYIYKGTDPFSSHNKIARLVVNHKSPITDILDVGCNKGFIGQVLKENGWQGQISGLDKDKTYKKDVLKLKYKKFYEINLEDTFKLEGKFDAIIIGDVLEHLVNPIRALKQLKTYLKPKGIFIISLPNIANFYIRLSLLLGKFDYAEKGILDIDHKYFYTQKTALAMLKKSTLKIKKVKPTPIPLPAVHPLFQIKKPLFVFHGFSDVITRSYPRFFAYQFIFVCTV
ncbi:class I SAM-dependent methyltransferase [Candidatus Beckwithbacteria bacterium]|nr:class I SAM-dependent methyltransferase [Candidatus Beckwithbacteria bacterium]